MKSFQEWLVSINESVTFTVAGHDYSNQIKDLNDLGNFLSRKIIVPHMSKLSEEDLKKAQQIYPDSISPDFSTWQWGEGEEVLNFYTAGFETMLPKMLDAIKYFLDDLGIQYGQMRTEKSGVHNSDVIRIPILNMKKLKDPAPEVNMSNRNARIIVHDLLQFPDPNEDEYKLPVADLLIRINNVQDYLIDIHTVEPYSVSKKNQEEELKSTIFNGGLSFEQIKRHLDSLEKLALWAKTNGYDQINLI
jgi:hypothetical protein